MDRAAQGNTEAVLRGGNVDIGAVSRILKAEAVTFLTVLLICLALAITYLHVARVRYSVRMEIASASSNEQSKSGGLGALSSLAGFSLGGEGSPQFRLFLGSLRSPIAAEAIVSDQELLKAIFYREWSQSDGKWREPPSLLRAPLRAIARILGWKFAVWAPPGVNRVFDYLNDELKVIPDNKSGVVTMEIDSDRPDAAGRVLMTLNNAMNEHLREHDLEHATTFIGYLTKRLAEVSVVEYRSALIQNIAQEEKTRMQASSPLPYASDILGKPMVSSKPVSPKPLVTLGVGIFFGALLGFGLATLKHRRR
jgi:hypothetical protein